MNHSVFITNSGINKTTGGGIVSHNYIQALKKCTTLRYIISNQKYPDNKYEEIEAYSINPVDWGYKPPWNPTPFFQDYMAFNLIQKEPTELVMTYGCPMALTIEEMKNSFFCKVVADLAPHNIEISREEHMKYIGRYDFPHLVDDRLWSIYSRHLRFADRVIVHSKIGADYIKQKAHLAIDPDVIPHGCYLPEQISSYPSEVIPGYFGAIGFDKGIVYMATAWVNTSHKPETQLLIGGKMAQSFMVAEKYMPQFKIIGFVGNLADFYKQISFLIQSSVTEGFGITPLEAMAHNRPVIVARGAGISELITDGKDGFVVPIRDIGAIQAKIQYFIDNPDEINRMGVEARKTAEKYTWDIINKQYIKLFQELL